MSSLDLKEVVITLFKQPIPASDTASRAVLSRVLGNPALDFEKPFITIESPVYVKWYSDCSLLPIDAYLHQQGLSMTLCGQHLAEIQPESQNEGKLAKPFTPIVLKTHYAHCGYNVVSYQKLQCSSSALLMENF